jgi:hypothetical protein
MTKLYKGKIYLLSNPLYNGLKKIGVSNNTKIRINTMQTGLPDDIQILCESETLIDKYFYEYFLSKILFKYRYRKDREFYEIDNDTFVQLTKTIELINKMNDTEEKLLEFIKNFDNEYYKRRFNKKPLYVCTL